MVQKIEIERNGNKVVIAPIFEKKGIVMTVNGKEYRNLELNSKNQFVSTYQKIGVQLNNEQVEQIKKWKNEFAALRKQEDEEKRAEIKNKPVRELSFKFHNYMTEKYVHTEKVQLSTGKYVYSNEGYEIMDAILSLSLDELEKLGIERRDDVWSEITLSDEDKEFILKQGAINKAESEKVIEKIEKDREEKMKAKKLEAEKKKAEALKEAIKTGEKQVIDMKSVMAEDGNLILIYEYIHPDGSTSKSEFYDGD